MAVLLRGEPLVHCIEFLHLVALGRASWAGGALVTLDDCYHLAGPELGGSLSGSGDCFRLRPIDWEGFLCLFPAGDNKRQV
jgi:hypothetical protein